MIEVNKNTSKYNVNPRYMISDTFEDGYKRFANEQVASANQKLNEFAKKFGIEIIQVLDGGDISESAYTEDGLHINSEFLNGLNKLI